jgi:RimJ/RimL family protein N-acetyltransferase
MIELKLTKANRIRLARAFRGNKRVDISIDCVIEGQMGRAFEDDSENPTAFQIEVGPFRYFAGDARSPGGHEMIKNLPPFTLLMPPPAEWMEVAKEIHGEKLNPFSRYSFSSENLSVEHLGHLLTNSPFKNVIQQIDPAIATDSLKESDSIVDVSEFDSAEDFMTRGIGFCVMDNKSMIGAAYSSLVCSKGIEVSMFVFPEHRRKGIATALGSKLLKWCLENNMDANWDAANPGSCKLAEKLGYVYTGTYDAYFLKA